MKFWARVKRQTVGPFTVEEIRKHPEIGDATLLCPEDATDAKSWKRLREIPGLRDVKGGASGSPAPPPTAACPKCRAETDPESRFCAKCGESLARGGVGKKRGLGHGPQGGPLRAKPARPITAPERKETLAKVMKFGLPAVAILVLVVVMADEMSRPRHPYTRRARQAAKSRARTSRPVPKVELADEVTREVIGLTDFRWGEDGDYLYFLVRFKSEFVEGRMLSYEAYDARGVVIASGDVVRFSSGRNTKVFEKKIFFTSDDRHRVARIIFSY